MVDFVSWSSEIKKKITSKPFVEIKTLDAFRFRRVYNFNLL
jgi:hypothetical protein